MTKKIIIFMGNDEKKTNLAATMCTSHLNSNKISFTRMDLYSQFYTAVCGLFGLRFGYEAYKDNETEPNPAFLDHSPLFAFDKVLTFMEETYGRDFLGLMAVRNIQKSMYDVNVFSCMNDEYAAWIISNNFHDETLIIHIGDKKEISEAKKEHFYPYQSEDRLLLQTVIHAMIRPFVGLE